MNFKTEFIRAVQANNVDFIVRGMLGFDDRVYPLGSDTKVLSTIFELFSHPIIEEIAKANDYVVEEAPQTIYPDFTLSRTAGVGGKIAIDIKTTYRRPGILFTLGSYTSFLRNNTKNILFPYDQYDEHWVIGFVYSRRDVPAGGISSFEDRGQLIPPYQDVEWFIQEKYKIAGEAPGSGNTANIGSIRSINLDDFREGRGPFANHGEEVFRDYWANFEKDARQRPYRNIPEYLRWRKRTTRR